MSTGNVKKTFDIPESWKLVALMPFGNPTAAPNAKTYLPLEGRLIVKN